MDDGDERRVYVRFEESNGRLVPSRLTVGGLLRGSIVLTALEETGAVGAASRRAAVSVVGRRRLMGLESEGGYSTGLNLSGQVLFEASWTT